MTAFALFGGGAAFGAEVRPSPLALARPQVKTLDEQLLEVAASVPAFAGMYYDEAGRLVVRLAQPEAEARLSMHAAERAISAVFGPERIPAAGLVPATATHTFTRLKALHERITPGVLAVAGAVMTDVDERTNRVAIGIESAAVRPGVERVLQRLGAAREMVELVELGPIHPISVQDGWRPVTGGLQIETPGVYCTLGFSALWGGTLGFVTNSHCTQTQGGVEYTPAWQATSQAPYPSLAGTEVNDPSYFSGGSCPAGRICRASDSAFFRAETTVNPLIAATPGPWDLSVAAWLEVPGKVLYPSQGQVVSKTGRTTGTTTGTIQWACATINSAGGPHTYLCNYIATSTAQNGAGGDSGSPVYFRSGGNARLTGIVWGAGSNPWHFAFSPLGGIQNELGVVPYCQGFVGC
jgi:hypothetical protein